MGKEKRLPLTVLVDPVTLDATKRLSKFLGLSQGEFIDDAVAGVVSCYADSPLEADEQPASNERATPERVERAMTRKQKAIAELRASDPMADERPEIEYGSEVLPTSGSVNAKKSAAVLSEREIIATQAARKAKWEEERRNRPPDAYRERYRGPLLKPGSGGKR